MLRKTKTRSGRLRSSDATRLSLLHVEPWKRCVSFVTEDFGHHVDDAGASLPLLLANLSCIYAARSLQTHCLLSERNVADVFRIV